MREIDASLGVKKRNSGDLYQLECNKSTNKHGNEEEILGENEIYLLTSLALASFLSAAAAAGTCMQRWKGSAFLVQKK